MTFNLKSTFGTAPGTMKSFRVFASQRGKSPAMWFWPDRSNGKTRRRESRASTAITRRLPKSERRSGWRYGLGLIPACLRVREIRSTRLCHLPRPSFPMLLQLVLRIQELQIDFDCPESKLDGYRVWIEVQKKESKRLACNLKPLPERGLLREFFTRTWPSGAIPVQNSGTGPAFVSEIDSGFPTSESKSPSLMSHEIPFLVTRSFPVGHSLSGSFVRSDRRRFHRRSGNEIRPSTR